MSKCLVVGGMGFIGSNIAKHLKSKGHEVVIMDSLVRRGSEINIQIMKDLRITFIHGDVRCPEDLNYLPWPFDFIFDTAAEAAACTGYNNPLHHKANNFDGLINLLSRVKDTGGRMIFWSTNKVYSGEAINSLTLIEKETRFEFDSTDPDLSDWGTSILRNGIPENFSIDGGSHSLYGLSKACADITCQEWAKSFGLKVIVNRFSCLAGPSQFGKTEQGWCSWFCMAALFDLPVVLYGFKGKQVRDVLFIPDILNLIDIQMKEFDDVSGQVFNIGGGLKVNTSLIEYIELIEGLTGKKINQSYDSTVRVADQCVYLSDIRKAKNLLGWEPNVGLKEGTQQILDWIKDHEIVLKKLYNV